MNSDLVSAVINAANNLSAAFWAFLWVLAGLLGFIFGAKTIYAWIQDTQRPGPPTVSNGSKLSVFFIGVFLVNLPRFIDMTSESIGLGTRGYSPIAYSNTEQFGALAQGIDAVLTLAAMFGGWFALKGLLLLKAAAETSGRGQYSSQTMAQGLGHMVGGACLVQIPKVIDLAVETLGISW